MNLFHFALLAMSAAHAEALQSEQARERADLSAYAAALVPAMNSSTSPRERALATTISFWNADDGSTPRDRGRALRAAAAAAPGDVLVQAIWARAEVPESGCDLHSPCPDRRVAQARLEPDNAVAWVAVFDDLDPVHDEAEVQANLEKIASSSTAEDHYIELIESWLQAMHLLSKPIADSQSDSDAATSFSAGSFPHFGQLFKACKRVSLPTAPARRFELCAQAGRGLRDRSQTLLTRVVGAALINSSGESTEQDLAARRRLRWYQEATGLLAKESKDHGDQLVADILSTHSEIRAIELLMARHATPLEPPADWQPTEYVPQK